MINRKIILLLILTSSSSSLLQAMIPEDIQKNQDTIQLRKKFIAGEINKIIGRIHSILQSYDKAFDTTEIRPQITIIYNLINRMLPTFYLDINNMLSLYRNNQMLKGGYLNAKFAEVSNSINLVLDRLNTLQKNENFLTNPQTILIMKSTLVDDINNNIAKIQIIQEKIEAITS
jgi:hypothetical protein